MGQANGGCCPRIARKIVCTTCTRQASSFLCLERHNSLALCTAVLFERHCLQYRAENHFVDILFRQHCARQVYHRCVEFVKCWEQEPWCSAQSATRRMGWCAEEVIYGHLRFDDIRL
eukprot:gnl/TRDRNA2_/TRDRNA2_218658_c0_seq1.p1 gnl/TRDRNA2_/TRDRNA2_218658_c0~~gnl/TRDRNA2_/TRDRNA2_218658_c0_seq1.p1  ORF type:complete len:117 (-),score=6.14 gnl/TRDRNA2_/TRDRNA2_218658_c0_seq1:114-464(-)